MVALAKRHAQFGIMTLGIIGMVKSRLQWSEETTCTVQGSGQHREIANCNRPNAGGGGVIREDESSLKSDAIRRGGGGPTEVGSLFQNFTILIEKVDPFLRLGLLPCLAL